MLLQPPCWEGKDSNEANEYTQVNRIQTIFNFPQNQQDLCNYTQKKNWPGFYYAFKMQT